MKLEVWRQFLDGIYDRDQKDKTNDNINQSSFEEEWSSS